LSIPYFSSSVIGSGDDFFSILGERGAGDTSSMALNKRNLELEKEMENEIKNNK